MADDKKITQLDPLTIADSQDVFAIVDVSADETMQIRVSNLMGSPGPIGVTAPNPGTFTDLQLDTLKLTGPQVDEISINTDLGTNDDVLPTQNAVKTYVDNAIATVSSAIVNPRHVSSDSTALIGDVMLVDTTNGDVSIELIETPKGTIIIKKVSPDANSIIVTSRNGFIYNESALPSFAFSGLGDSFTFVTDAQNFYIV